MPGRFRLYTALDSGTGMALAFIDFLDPREKAAVLWAITVLTFAVAREDGAGSSFRSVVRAFFAPKLQLLFGSAALYCAGVVALARWLDAWHMATLKATVYWFVSGGVVLTGRAVSHAAPFDFGFYRKLLRDAVRFTIVVEFLVNLYVFPFLAELVLVPTIIFFVAMQVVAANDDSLTEARKPIGAMMAAISVFLLAHVIVGILHDPGGLLTKENVETLLVAPVLTFAFIPFLWAWAWISRREQDKLRRRFRASYDPLV